MTVTLGFLFLLVAVSGTGIALSRRPGRQVLAMSAHGMTLTLLFVALQAPDVAFAELVVGMVAVPLLVMAVLASIGMDRGPHSTRNDAE